MVGIFCAVGRLMMSWRKKMAHEIIIPLNTSQVPNLRRNLDFVCKSPAPRTEDALHIISFWHSAFLPDFIYFAQCNMNNEHT